MPDQTSRELSTLGIHGATHRRHAADGVVAPVVASTSYRFPSAAALEQHHSGEEARPDYSRYHNPTVREVESLLAALEGAEDALLTGCGMAALSTAFLALLQPGQKVVHLREGYRPSGQFFAGFLARWGVASQAVPCGDLEALEQALEDRAVRAVFLELPTNPKVLVPDLPAIVAVCRKRRGVRVVVDATLATPVLVRPLALGADLVLHSATKALGGHNDLLAGVVAGKAAMVEAIRDVRHMLGTVLDPQSAWLLQRGLKTLSMRVDRQCSTATALAARLQAHPAVKRVWYPTVPSHPDHGRSTGWLDRFGGLLSFELKPHAAPAAVLDGLSMIAHAASLGGAETMMHQPARFSYSDLDGDGLRDEGIEPGLLRLACGLEDVGDIWIDLERALTAAVEVGRSDDARGR